MKKYITGLKHRFDGWSNPKTGIGTYDSRVNSTKYESGDTLNKKTLSALYRGDGIAKRVVNLIVEDATREFMDAEEELLEELERIQFKQKIIECSAYARLYGGAAIVVYSDDGVELEGPINLKGLRKVVKLVVYDRHELSWEEDDINQNYYDEDYGEPNVYTITDEGGEPFRVHRTRMLFMGGILTTKDVRKGNGGWDDSAIQPVYTALLNYASVKNSSAEIVQDFIQKVLTVGNLLGMLDGGRQGYIQNRLKNLDLELSNAQILAIEEGTEKYEKHTSSVAGLPELWNKFAESVSASSEIPMSQLFGRAVGGLSEGSDNDITYWNNRVNAYRKDNYTPIIDRMIEVLDAQAMWESSKRPADLEWTFANLETPDEEETARVRHLTAQTDSIYINMGAVDPRELYKLRYANGVFQQDIEVPEGGEDFNDIIDFSGNEDLLKQEEELSEKDRLFQQITNRFS